MGQTSPEKEVNQQMQTWISLNSLISFREHWAIIGDVHLRTNEFFDSTNFVFLREGVSYIPSSSVSISGGYAHIWLHPSND